MYSRKMSSLTSYATVTKRFSSPNTMMGSTRNQVPAALDREGAPKHRNQQSISRFWDLVEEKNRIIIKSGYSVWEETNIYLQLMPSTGLGTKMRSAEFVHHCLLKGAQVSCQHLSQLNAFQLYLMIFFVMQFHQKLTRLL